MNRDSQFLILRNRHSSRAYPYPSFLAAPQCMLTSRRFLSPSSDFSMISRTERVAREGGWRQETRRISSSFIRRTRKGRRALNVLRHNGWIGVGWTWGNRDVEKDQAREQLHCSLKSKLSSSPSEFNYRLLRWAAKSQSRYSHRRTSLYMWTARESWNEVHAP